MKQKVPTSKNERGEYVGTYRGEAFTVWKSGNNLWNGTVEMLPTRFFTEGRKRDVVNAIVDEIDFELGTEEETTSYDGDMKKGVSIYKIQAVRERDYKYNERTKIHSSSESVDFLNKIFEGKDREEFWVVFFDSARTVTGTHQVSVGAIDSATVDVKSIFKAALLANASSILVAHNHPSGNPEPSAADIRITRKINEASKVMDCPLQDHVIIAEGEGTSLASRGLIP